MKRILKVPVMLLVTVSFFLFSGCNKKSASTVTTTTVTYRGVVLAAICCQDVILSVGTPSIGQAKWVDSGDATYPVYHNVFKVANPCQFGNHVAGDTITFNIVPQTVQNCICCMVYIPTPSTAYAIQVIN